MKINKFKMVVIGTLFSLCVCGSSFARGFVTGSAGPTIDSCSANDRTSITCSEAEPGIHEDTFLDKILELLSKKQAELNSKSNSSAR